MCIIEVGKIWWRGELEIAREQILFELLLSQRGGGYEPKKAGRRTQGNLFRLSFENFDELLLHNILGDG